MKIVYCKDRTRLNADLIRSWFMVVSNDEARIMANGSDDDMHYIAICPFKVIENETAEQFQARRSAAVRVTERVLSQFDHFMKDGADWSNEFYAIAETEQAEADDAKVYKTR